jgi:hypothetical protein
MRRFVLLGVLSWSLASGCQEEEAERPPPYPECPPSNPACPFHPPLDGSLGSAGSPGEGGTAGTVGEGGAGEGGAAAGAPPLSVDIEGSVSEYANAGFKLTSAYTRNAVVESEGFERGTVRASFEGTGTFLLRDVRNQEPIWLSVRPDPETERELRTLHPVLDLSKPVLVPIVGRALIEQLVFGLLPTAPAVLSERAQAVLFFRDPEGRPLSGIVAELAEAGVIAYSRSGGWSDQHGTTTDLSGLVVLGNIAARAYPGNDVRIDFSGAEEGFADIRVAAGAVTVVELIAR